MSVYSTPCQYLDEETSCSEDSVYTTPETSFTDLVSDGCCLPKSDIFDWKPRDIFNLNTPLRTEGSIYPNKVRRSPDSALDKENIGCSPANTRQYRELDESTPLKCITSALNVDQSYGKPLPSFADENKIVPESLEKTATVPKRPNSDEKNVVSTKPTQCNLLRRMRLLPKFKSDYKILKETKISIDDESTSTRIPKVNYGSISSPNEEQETTEFSSEEKSTKFPSQPLSFSVWKKWRFINLKRLFRRSIRGVHSYYLKYIPYIRKKGYERVEPLDDSGSCNVMNAEPTLKVDVQVENLDVKSCNTQELLTTVILKLSSVESEIRELKSLVKENSTRVPSLVYHPPPPPPPPPPPFPSNLIGSSTPKRKVDLTTPENQQLAKRPPRVPEQRAQFSITVEDLRNVKLRKIGKSVAKKNIAERNILKESISLPSSTRAVGSRFKRNRTVDKELSEIAAELLSPRTKDNAAEPTSIGSRNPSIDTNTSPNIYEQTPKRTKRKNSMFSRKRMELLNESPARKRLNGSGLSPLE